MTVLLSAMMVVLLGADMLEMDLSLGAGLSVKNAFVYVIAVLLAMRMAINKQFRLEAAAILACFGILIAYAVVSWLLIILVLHYAEYTLRSSLIDLKSGLIDQAVFFLLFFYGVTSAESAIKVAKWLFVGVTVVASFTVAHNLGVLHLGFIQDRQGGRVWGASSGPNEFAAFLAMYIPSIMVCAIDGKGFGRVLWSVAATVCVAALLMTFSRGGLLALALSAIIGGYWLGPRLPKWKLLVVGAAVILVGIAIMAGFRAVSPEFDRLVEERIATTLSVDRMAVSAGRTEIWREAVSRMMHTPITLLTGFGFGAYDRMGFAWTTHNDYLHRWFDLGVVGLACTILLLWLLIRTARRAAEGQGTSREGGLLIGFAIGIVAIAVAMFFNNLADTWKYVWPFAGLMMRVAVDLQRRANVSLTGDLLARSASGQPGVRPPVRYGWTAGGGV